MRIRSIKPDVLKDEALWDLEAETGLPVYRAWTGLWMAADREGRFEWRPRMLKAEILPYWDGDFARVLDALATRDFLVKYTCGGREYGHVRTFKKHQIVNNREAQSVLPAPPDDSDEAQSITDTSTRAPRVVDASTTPLVHARGEGKGREGKGRRGTRVKHASSSASPPDLSGETVATELTTLLDRYPNQAILAEAREGCALTRRNGKLADTVWLRTIRKLDTYPIEAVTAACETFVARYADGTKDEQYLVGIARGKANGREVAQTRFGSASGMMPPAPASAFVESEDDWDTPVTAGGDHG